MWHVHGAPPVTMLTSQKCLAAPTCVSRSGDVHVPAPSPDPGRRASSQRDRQCMQQAAAKRLLYRGEAKRSKQGRPAPSVTRLGQPYCSRGAPCGLGCPRPCHAAMGGMAPTSSCAHAAKSPSAHHKHHAQPCNIATAQLSTTPKAPDPWLLTGALPSPPSRTPHPLLQPPPPSWH